MTTNFGAALNPDTHDSEKEGFIFNPIGIIHTPFTDKSATPIQPFFSIEIGKVEVYPSFEKGLLDLEGFSHIYLIYALHLSMGYSLLVKPFLDDRLRGLFSTRHPRRPNPIGISVVRLLEINRNWLTFEGADMLEGSPLLDIKPFVPEFDTQTKTRVGWYPLQSKE